jgi:hypothetical protein
MAESQRRFVFAINENATIHTLIRKSGGDYFPVLDAVGEGVVLHSKDEDIEENMDEHPPSLSFLKGVVMVTSPINSNDVPRDMAAYEYEALKAIQDLALDGHEPKTSEVEELMEYAMAHVQHLRPTNKQGPAMREGVLSMDEDHIDADTTFVDVEDGFVENEDGEKEVPLSGAQETADVQEPAEDKPVEMKSMEDPFTDPLLEQNSIPMGYITTDVPSVPSARIGKFLSAGYDFRDLVNADPAQVAEDVEYVSVADAEEIVQEANTAARRKLLA